MSPRTPGQNCLAARARRGWRLWITNQLPTPPWRHLQSTTAQRRSAHPSFCDHRMSTRAIIIVPTGLHQDPALGEARESSATDHDVVENIDPEQLASRYQLRGHHPILG